MMSLAVAVPKPRPRARVPRPAAAPVSGPVAADLARPCPTAADPRWARVVARDRAADGAFWYSVATTGVYCRPSCASRTANPENVTLHDSLAAARATGARACKRCRPDDASATAASASLVAAACRSIEAAEAPPPLGALAAAAGLSPSHFHRLFKAITGLTPRAYGAAHRARRVRERLGEGGTITAALHDAGFGSSGRFYERTGAMLGMTPSRYRAGGAAETIRFAVGATSLGAVLVASTEKGVVAILLGDDPEALVRDLQDRFPKATLVGGDGDYERRVALVVGLVEAPGVGLELPLDVRGTAFQERVWTALARIPPGQTASYRAIAEAVGAPGAVRAVARACARNPLAVAIPCHRVVRADGAPSGYAWGIDRKEALLARERAVTASTPIRA